MIRDLKRCWCTKSECSRQPGGPSISSIGNLAAMGQFGKWTLHLTLSLNHFQVPPCMNGSTFLPLLSDNPIPFFTKDPSFHCAYAPRWHIIYKEINLFFITGMPLPLPLSDLESRVDRTHAAIRGGDNGQTYVLLQLRSLISGWGKEGQWQRINDPYFLRYWIQQMLLDCPISNTCAQQQSSQPQINQSHWLIPISSKKDNLARTRTFLLGSTAENCWSCINQLISFTKTGTAWTTQPHIQGTGNLRLITLNRCCTCWRQKIKMKRWFINIASSVVPGLME